MPRDRTSTREPRPIPKRPGRIPHGAGATIAGARGNHAVPNKPACIAAGLNGDGEKHVPGIWLAKTPPFFTHLGSESLLGDRTLALVTRGRPGLGL